MKYFIALFLMVVSFGVMAATINTDAVAGAGFNKLTEKQKAEIILQVANASNASEKVSPAGKVNEWLDIGSRIGQGFAGAAKELGIAVNDFAKTPVGELTTYLIIWHFMGSMVVHLFAGMALLIASTLMLWYVYKKQTCPLITYDPTKQDLFGRNRILSVQHKELESGDHWGFIWMWMFCMVASTIVMFTW